MANAQQQENMLLTEHFSWPPITLIDDIINTVNEVLYRCTDTFETGITSAPPHLLGFSDRYAAEHRTPDRDAEGNPVYPDAALEIEEGVLKLETLMENAVDKNFDKLEIWTLRNVLCLPRGEAELARWVRLGHYEGVEVGRGKGEGEGALSPERLFALRRKLVETRKLHVALEEEKRRNEALIGQLKALVRPVGEGTKSEVDGTADAGAGAGAFSFLTHHPAAQSLGLTTPSSLSSTTSTSTANPPPAPLTTHTAFTTSHLPHLRNLLASLRPHLASTALPAPPTNTTNNGSDRKLYLESQSKRILERRGVDTQDGVEGGVEGGRVRSEEVKGLEGVAEALERKGRRNGRGDTVGEEQGEAEADEMDTS